MKTRTINPRGEIYPATDDYVHALEVTGAQRFLYVSGTMGLEPDGVIPDGVADQLRVLWNNLRRILDEADMSVQNIVRLTSYLTDAADAQANQDARIAALGRRRVPTTAIIVSLLDPRWKAEIEIVAAA
jgi:2-iminobutanoate/2-iminopropanoate deaminase